MLDYVEDYLRRVQSARSDSGIIALLGQLAIRLGFRSAYLIEYAIASISAPLVLDSASTRAHWWGNFISDGLHTSNKPLAEELASGQVRYFNADSATSLDNAARASFRRAEMSEMALVPISFDSSIVGLVGLCGRQTLSGEQEHALTMVCYSLFSQVRSLRLTGIRTAMTTLTPRELEVMSLSSEGLTSQEVADQLGMAARTVNQHLDNVAEKLGTSNRVHTVAEAIRRNLL